MLLRLLGDTYLSMLRAQSGFIAFGAWVKVEEIFWGTGHMHVPSDLLLHVDIPGPRMTRDAASDEYLGRGPGRCIEICNQK